MSDLQNLRFQLLAIRGITLLLPDNNRFAEAWFADAEKFIAETEATLAAWYPPPEPSKPGVPDPHKFP